MNEKQKVLQLIEAMQQKEKDGSLLWCVAEDLKAMASSLTDDEAQLVATDLEAGTHDLAACEKEIRAYANKHKDGKVACCPGPMVPKILRKCFGLPEETATAAQAAAQESVQAPAEPAKPKRKRLDILDFM